MSRGQLYRVRGSFLSPPGFPDRFDRILAGGRAWHPNRKPEIPHLRVGRLARHQSGAKSPATLRRIGRGRGSGGGHPTAHLTPDLLQPQKTQPIRTNRPQTPVFTGEHSAAVRLFTPLFSRLCPRVHDYCRRLHNPPRIAGVLRMTIRTGRPALSATPSHFFDYFIDQTTSHGASDLWPDVL